MHGRANRTTRQRRGSGYDVGRLVIISRRNRTIAIAGTNHYSQFLFWLMVFIFSFAVIIIIIDLGVKQHAAASLGIGRGRDGRGPITTTGAGAGVGTGVVATGAAQVVAVI